MSMSGAPIDLAEELTSFSEHWSPKVVARLNDDEIKVEKVKGVGVVNTGSAGAPLTLAYTDSLA